MMAHPIRCCGHAKLINNSLFGKPGLGKLFAELGRQIRHKNGCNKTGCCKPIDQTEGKAVEEWPKPDTCPSPPWRCECPREPQPTNYDPYRIKVPDVVVPPLPCSEAKPMLDCAKQRGPCSAKPPPLDPPCPPPPRPPFPWIYVWPVALFFTTMGLIYKAYLWREEKERLSESKPIWRPRRKIKKPFHASDLPACVQYLIIGTGAAGWAAYETIMKYDKTAKIFFMTKEDIIPYIRPPLTKYMWWNEEPPDLKTLSFVVKGKRETMYYKPCNHFMDPVKFARKKTGPAVSIASGWCVIRVDPEEHRVWVRTLDGEQPIYYERCLIAAGSKPKNLNLFDCAPKAVRDRVCTMRTIRDLEIAYRRVKEAKKVVVIGGGCIGTELAWHLGRMNKVVERPEDKPPLEVVHLIKDKGLLAGLVPEYLGEWAVEKIREEGVTVMPKTQVYDAFERPDGKLELTLSNGTGLVADYVFVAVGSEPREELAEPSCLELDRKNGGFLVNTELEARSHLYVAGDCASFYSQWKDTRLRCEHFMNAVEQGEIAGANMTGQWEPCNIEPHFWLRLEDELQVEVVGEVGACMPTVGVFKQCSDEEVAKNEHFKGEGDHERPCYKKADEYKNRFKRGLLFYLRGEIVVGMVMWNIPPVDDRTGVVTEFLRARPTYKDINMLSELLGFPETQCTYHEAAKEKDIGPCIMRYKEY